MNGSFPEVHNRTPMKKQTALVIIGTFGAMALSACQASPEQKMTEIQNIAKINKIELNTCYTLTPEDIALITKLPVEKLQPIVTPIKQGEWICSYGEDAAASFTVTVSPNREEAAKAMNEYRKNLELDAGTVPAEKYPQGTYSDISGTGEEAIYSYMSDTLFARENAVSILVMSPQDKLQKINLATTFFYKIKQK